MHGLVSSISIPIMAIADAAYWDELLRQALGGYDEALLREVAARLIKPRSHWPVEELIARMAAAVENPAVLDRRLQDLQAGARQVLACIGHSRQPRWQLGNLVELAVALGQADGLRPIFDLLSGGLLFPDPGPTGAKVKSFEQWLAYPSGTGLTVFTPPLIAARAIGEDLGLPDLSTQEPEALATVPPSSLTLPALDGMLAAQEADGLEWLLRLGVLWQQVADGPLRRTQQGGFFKRDADRLGQDALLNAAPHERLADVPDLGYFVEALAEQEGILREADGEVQVGAIPESWDRGLAAALEALWADLPRIQSWNPRDGWRGGEAGGNPFPSACLLACLLLARLPEGAWARTDTIEAWITDHHPYWVGESLRPSRHNPWVGSFLLGVAYHLRLVQAARDASSDWQVRLAPLGRWLLGKADAPVAEPVYPQTLLMQPNLEVVAYRQGLTPGLVGKLTCFAQWKSLGAACTLQLGPESIYRALESGQTFDTIRLTLEQHGTRAVPPAVLDSLRTWANKRERLTVYPAATLLEFASAADLNEALARGLPGVRVAETLAVVASEEAIDYRHFRLTGTRDYALPPEKCVRVENDGVTLAVDLARSDLLLETELPRFAEPVVGPSLNGQRHYRLTPASLAAGREQGLSPMGLESWFHQRTGGPMSPAARLLLAGGQVPAPRLRRHLVLHVGSADLADGLMQWPPTRALIAERLGPTALAVEEHNVKELRQRLAEAGISVIEAVPGSVE
jgi:hypothetical protein